MSSQVDHHYQEYQDCQENQSYPKGRHIDIKNA